MSEATVSDAIDAAELQEQSEALTKRFDEFRGRL